MTDTKSLGNNVSSTLGQKGPGFTCFTWLGCSCALPLFIFCLLTVLLLLTRSVLGTITLLLLAASTGGGGGGELHSDFPCSRATQNNVWNNFKQISLSAKTFQPKACIAHFLSAFLAKLIFFFSPTVLHSHAKLESPDSTWYLDFTSFLNLFLSVTIHAFCYACYMPAA